MLGSDAAERIEAETTPLRGKAELLTTIPDVTDRIAETVTAETGADMSRFRSAMALASWAGVAPRDNESAGRNLAGTTTHSNVWLLGALGTAAAAAGVPTCLGACYKRLAKPRGPERALAAVMHKITIARWHILIDGVAYHDTSAPVLDGHRHSQACADVFQFMDAPGPTPDTGSR